MGTVRFPEQGEYDVEADAAPEAEGGTCGVLGRSTTSGCSSWASWCAPTVA